MPENFTETFQYGLNDLPLEPPDDFNSPYPSGQPSARRMPPLGASHVVQAGFGLPRARQFPPPWPAPGGSAPPIPKPELPDWWRTLWPIIQLYPRLLRDFGGGRGGRRGKDGDDGDDCYERWEAEDTECNWREPQFVRGCKDRAADRRSLCYRNGGRPDPNEPPKWGWADEEGPRGPRKPRR